MNALRLLSFPFALLYRVILYIRNKLYDLGILSSASFDTPVIVVGNLSMGGTGKSPHIEYISKLLISQGYKVASLSRGYGRKTKGFILADENTTAMQIGDEPAQFKRKLKGLLVAVDEKRVNGIQRLKELFPDLQTILLDDAFQHRSVKPGLSILLTDYTHPFYNDYLLPAGTLREYRSAYKRADVIVITKLPEKFLETEKENILQKIAPMPYQQVYFSYIVYGDFVPFSKKAIHKQEVIKEFFFDAGYSILLFTGIANNKSLVDFLESHGTALYHKKFPDHHIYSDDDVNEIKKEFNNIKSPNKIILTTEKDAVRLTSPELRNILDELPVYYVPIEIKFYGNDETAFNKKITDYVKGTTANR